MSTTPGKAVTGVFVGLTTLDLIQRVAALPGPNQKVTALRVDVAAGGPATNAAVTFARLGGAAVLASAVGRGPFARAAAQDLAAFGVGLVDHADNDGELRVSSIVVEDATGHRSVVSRNAADIAVHPSRELPELVRTAEVVLVDGHHPALALAACQAARDHGVPVILDAGSWKAILASLLPFVTVAVCSADFRLPDRTDPFAALLSWGVQAVAITHGGDPVEWRDESGSGEITVPRVTVKDTLGAGDVFHGAFAYAWASGVRDLPTALKMATEIAAIRVQHVGPRSWLQHVGSM
jgi:sugar/nucleoside kinase (ribokinase family)